MSDDPRLSFRPFSDEERQSHLAVLLRGAALLQLLLVPALGVAAAGIRWAGLRLETAIERDVSKTSMNPIEFLLHDERPRSAGDDDEMAGS